MAPLSSSMWFSHRECQREAAQKTVLGKSADSGWMVRMAHRRAAHALEFRVQADAQPGYRPADSISSAMRLRWYTLRKPSSRARLSTATQRFFVES